MTGKDKIILQKITKYIHSALSYVEGMAYDEFMQDEKTMSATAFVLGQIGELAKELGLDAQEAHPGIPWKAIRGMRNKIVHDYENLDFIILWETITVDLPELLAQIGSLMGKDGPHC